LVSKSLSEASRPATTEYWRYSTAKDSSAEIATTRRHGQPTNPRPIARGANSRRLRMTSAPP
jgi:hypothetical protein